MTDHIYHVCDDDNCTSCNYGLYWCTVCHGAERSLTTECCGRPLTDYEQEEVGYTLDYANGEWIEI